jgi:hypothetical protein
VEVQAWEQAAAFGARKTPFGHPPEAAPLIAMMEAVRDRDREKFLNAHGFARLRPGDSIEKVAQSCAELYGKDWKVSDFEYAFFGTSERGVLATRFRGQMLRGKVFVANQNGTWLIVGAEP